MTWPYDLTIANCYFIFMANFHRTFWDSCRPPESMFRDSGPALLWHSLLLLPVSCVAEALQ